MDWPIEKDWKCTVCHADRSLFGLSWSEINGIFRCNTCGAYYALRTYDKSKTEPIILTFYNKNNEVAREVRMPPDYVLVPIPATTQPWLKLLEHTWPTQKRHLDDLTMVLDRVGRLPGWLEQALKDLGFTRDQFER